MGCVSDFRYTAFLHTLEAFNTAKKALKEDFKMPLKDWFRVLNIPQECLSKKSPRTGDMFSAWRILSVFNYKIDPMDLVKCDLVDPHLIECDHGLSERLKVDALYEYYVDSQQNELTEIRREAAMELPRYCHQHLTFFVNFAQGKNNLQSSTFSQMALWCKPLFECTSCIFSK